MTEGILAIVALLAMAGLGVPVGVAMILVSVIGIWLIIGEPLALSMLRTLPWSTTSQYGFVVVPMFVLMGAFAANAGITREFFEAANRWLAGVRGGLYMATTVASAGFAAISGSTVVNATVFTRIAMPDMIRLKYDRGFGAGAIAAAGTIAGLIPPSLVMVIYGLLTQVSIGAMLVAGILPGLLTALAYIACIAVMLRLRPALAPMPERRYAMREKLESLKGIWAMFPLVAIVLGGIYGGFISPSSAGTIGAAGALALALLRRKLTRAGFLDALLEAATLTAVVFVIIIGGLMLSRLLTISGFVPALTAFVTELGVTPMMFILLVVALYLVLGMFMESLSMMVVTVPFLFQIAMGLGIDPIWFGVIIVKLAEIAVITPPVGINLFAVMGASRGEVNSRAIFGGILPFIVADVIVLALLIAFPAISLWLPSNMAR